MVKKFKLFENQEDTIFKLVDYCDKVLNLKDAFLGKEYFYTRF
jgi:hypothetical protein